MHKGELRRAQHMDDQGLAPHGFHKPSGLEQGGIQRLHIRICQPVRRYVAMSNTELVGPIHSINRLIPEASHFRGVLR